MKYTGHIDILVLKKHEEDLKQYIADSTHIGVARLSTVIECALRYHPEWFDTYLSGIKEEE